VSNLILSCVRVSRDVVPHRLLALSALLGLCLLTPPATAEIYRYTDENGAVVLNRQGVPPEYVGRGYQVLNNQGRVIKVVPRALNGEEIKQMHAEKERLLHDERLLRLYSRPEDVDHIKQSKLREFDGLIKKMQNQLNPLSDQLALLYQQLAKSRSEGKGDSAHLTKQINQLKSEQRRLQELIVNYRAQRNKTEEEFNAEQARLAELLDSAAS